MSEIKKNLDPAGEIREEELKEVTTNDDSTGAGTPIISATVAVSVAVCPSTKCSSKC